MGINKPHLLIIDDDETVLSALKRLLIGEYDVLTITSAEEALNIIDNDYDPQIVIADFMLSNMTGEEFFKQLIKRRPHTMRILMSGIILEDQLIPLVDKGITHRIFTKPWNNEHLKIQLREVQQHYNLIKEKNSLEKLSLTDPLTGLFNRRGFNESFIIEIERSLRFGRDLSVAMMDLDHFKRYNDSEGHLEGDHLLKEIAIFLNKKLRNIDFISRFGGDEFALLMPDTGLHSAIEVCERIRIQFASQFSNKGITLSIGIATLRTHGTLKERLIQKADSALYNAKKQNGNRTCVAQTEKESQHE